MIYGKRNQPPMKDAIPIRNIDPTIVFRISLLIETNPINELKDTTAAYKNNLRIVFFFPCFFP